MFKEIFCGAGRRIYPYSRTCETETLFILIKPSIYSGFWDFPLKTFIFFKDFPIFFQHKLIAVPFLAGALPTIDPGKFRPGWDNSNHHSSQPHLARSQDW